jgi:predicted exporter
MKPLAASTRIALALLWLALLAVAGWAISHRLELSGDLRKFMPARVAPADRDHPHAARAADDLRTGSTGLA